MRAAACRRAYDHRMRDLVCEERDPHLFRHLGVPLSTAVSWIRRGPRPVVSADVLALDGAQLRAQTFRVFVYATAGAPAETGEMSWRKKPYEEGVANHFDPESCVGLPARAAAKR
jgi:hypothetical protein